MVTITTVNPATSSGDQSISIAIVDDTEDPVRYNSTATESVNLKDNTTPSESNPRISFEPYSSIPVSTTTMNNMVTFKILSSHMPDSMKQVDVRVSYDSSGTQFLTGGSQVLSRILDTADKETDLQVRISDPDGDNDNPNGTITVELVDGTGFTLADAPAHKTTATIIDETDRVVSIDAPAYVVEGESFTFTINATPELSTGESISVMYSVNHSGTHDYFDAASPASPVTLDMNNTKQDITVTTLQNVVDSPGADGQIQIQIMDGTGYTPLSTTPTIVTIQDKDRIPEVSIARIGPEMIDEGEAAVFELTAGTPGAATNFPVRVQITQPTGAGNFLATSESYFDNVPIFASTNKGLLRIPTIADTQDEINGSIAVTVQTDPAASDDRLPVKYVPPATPAMVIIRDNDVQNATTVVLVEGPNPASIYEGQSAKFTFIATPAPTGDDVVAVNYKIIEVGSFLSDTLQKTDQINITSAGPAIRSIPTISDDVVETDGSVAVQVLAYTTGGTVEYNVGLRAANLDSGPDFIAEVAVISDDVNDLTLPRVTITPVSTPISESVGTGVVQFTLSASTDPASSDTIMVPVVITQQGDFLDTTNLSRDVPVTIGVDKVIDVEIRDDDFDEPNGAIIATIQPDTTGLLYAIAGDNKTQVAVEDNDEPLNVSITRTGSTTERTATVEEGDASSENVSLSYDVTLSRSPAETVTVTYTVGLGSDSATLNEDYTVRDIPATGTLMFQAADPLTKMIVIDITEDSINEADESFTITITSTSTGVTIPTGGSRATGTIENDDNVLPVINIADAEGYEDDGSTNGTITFTLSLVDTDGAAVAAGRDIMVNFVTSNPTGRAAAETDDYTAVNRTGNMKVTISKGSMSEDVEVRTTMDSTPEADEKFTVTLSDPDFATLSGNGTAIGTILSDDDPVFLIDNGRGEEGDRD